MIVDRTFWLLGLPFDSIDMEQAVRRIQAASAARQRLIMVTPNVNFASMAARDPRFLQTVLDSQLSLVDGMPLVWLGRRMGIPFPERVAGSSLLFRLARETSATPLKVYFFGGEPGVSELAARRLPDFGPGLIPVGSLFPGFGSIDSMSTSGIIAQINEARPDLLILSLGAKKGQQWIAHNKDFLEAPVISHLGAAVNFIAGTVRRAPTWMQNSGIEWLWRIRQEPRLFRRYWEDGLYFLRASRQLGAMPPSTGLADMAPGRAERVGLAADNRWVLTGSLANRSETWCDDLLRQALPGNGEQGQRPVIDLAAVTGLDARSLGLLYALRYRGEPGLRPLLVCSSPQGLRLLRQQRAECLLSAAPGATPLH